MKPILFNTEMVRAILEGRKTVTRRVVKLKYSNTHLEMFTNKYGTRLIEKQNEEPGVTTVKKPEGITTHTLLACIEKEPPYRPGDILYVRETWTKLWYVDPDGYTHYDQPMYYYAADGTPDITLYDEDGFEEDDQRIRWRPSIHMPREAARIFLRVTDVRVDNLLCITRDGALKEGANPACAVLNFKGIWESTIKPKDRGFYGWHANPWVWVIEFERITKEEAERG